MPVWLHLKLDYLECAYSQSSGHRTGNIYQLRQSVLIEIRNYNKK